MKTTRLHGLLKMAVLGAAALGFPMAGKSAEVSKPNLGALAAQIHADELEENFAMPPDTARPWVYWFWSDGKHHQGRRHH